MEYFVIFLMLCMGFCILFFIFNMIDLTVDHQLSNKLSDIVRSKLEGK